MNPLDPAIYAGSIKHHRLTPKYHELNYRVFYFYFNVEKLDQLLNKTWMIGNSRLLPFSFNSRDYFGNNFSNNFSNNENPDKRRTSNDIAVNIKSFIKSKTGQNFRGNIMLLTQLRVFGYCFNPVSFYYCFNTADQLEYVVAEINNTPWDERYSYCLQWRADLPEMEPLHNKSAYQEFQFDKLFHVSPFNPMDMEYHWRLNAPGRNLNIHMENHKNNAKHFTATLALKHYELNAFNVNRMAVQFPLITLKVTWGIYWHALRLWLKRVPFYDHPDSIPKPANTDLPNTSKVSATSSSKNGNQQTKNHPTLETNNG